MKLRAWDKKHRQWLYDSDYCIHQGKPVRIYIRAFEDDYYEYPILENEYGQYKEDDNIIIQEFTGKLDKNRKEIYDGDLLKVNREFLRPYVKDGHVDWKFIKGETAIGQVYYFDVGTHWVVSFEHIKYDDIDSLEDTLDCEVVGNIFENPELLK